MAKKDIIEGDEVKVKGVKRSTRGSKMTIEENIDKIVKKIPVKKISVTEDKKTKRGRNDTVVEILDNSSLNSNSSYYKEIKKNSKKSKVSDLQSEEKNEESTVNNINNNNDDNGNGNKAIVIIFSGIEKEAVILDMVKKIKATVTDDPKRATHMITNDTLRRTPKLLTAINHGFVKYIVKLCWLIDSAKQRSPISLLKSNRYHLIDKDKEKLWNFNLLQTLANENRIINKIFQDLSFYLVPELFSNSDIKIPTKEEIEMIITSGGGIYLDKLPNINKNNSNNNTNIIIISDERIISNLTNNEINAFCNSNSKGIYSMEFIYISILKQFLDVENYILFDEKINQTKKKYNIKLDEEQSKKKKAKK